ncbi:MAG TPA: plasma-membrane proton-efflux P-type ATPase [Terriglobia bacterium]|nr:plasma-membrane proton-efflux P-type ATPase [Terriglobia bacterium]
MDSAKSTTTRRGLTSEEAAARLAQLGPNAVPEQVAHPILALLGKFWAPVPWMLEATIVLELLLGKRTEALIIGLLLVFNALLSLFQERKAQSALDLLRQRLSVTARVFRDGRWKMIDARGIVPGDSIHIRMGDLVPADTRLFDGHLLLDQSALTGESLPVEASDESTAYAGAVVKRGEATGEVVATGPRTYFGKTAELVSTAKTASHLQTIIFTIVKYLVVFDAILVALLFLDARVTGLPLREMLPFGLILLVASVPVALPATFTVATALGSAELAKSGVLVTRLSAIEEAAAMDVLLSDKTGTITENRLSVVSLSACSPWSETDLLRFACFASDEASQDPIDVAILSAARDRQMDLSGVTRAAFVPFDPATKLSESTVVYEGREIRAVKGAPTAVAARLDSPPDWDDDVQRFARQGYRVLAVAASTGDAWRPAGLLALQDSPRPDSKGLIASLRELGVRVLMVTGDGAATARAVAESVGIGTRACDSRDLWQKQGERVLDYDIFAGVYPEDKFDLVRSVQRTGHVSGMTGDGVNDAPALKQAEVGIAVSNATDVAKAAASLVLTNPGLGDILAAVKTSRRIYQRMLTYTLNKVIKTVEIALFLSLGVMLTRSFVITPLLVVLLLFTNDFVTMSIATDRVSYSRQPDRWHIRTLIFAGATLGSLVLMFSFSIFLYARDVLHLPLAQLQTLVFLTLVFSGQGMVYLVRERGHFWNSPPSRWLLVSSLADVFIVSALAIRGVLMVAVPVWLVAGLMGACATYLLGVDFLKIFVLRQFRPNPG